MKELEIFVAAVAIQTAGERAAYLDRACVGDTALRQRVEQLLAAHNRAGDFLEKPHLAPDGLEPAATLDQASEGPGVSLGPYRLLEKLGEGGMGTVWVAEQTVPFKRHVALKVIKPGMDSVEVLRRFESELQALAMMDHRNIAKVLDAGSVDPAFEPGVPAGDQNRTPESMNVSQAGKPELRPYFVMELVKGVPITKYCDELNLSLGERLELFVQVCRAIQHAHQKGIIHRDIKPSNVLVAIADKRPVVKVIDFGVAKALYANFAERSLHTAVGQLVGTLEYMSPEQAELSALDIDTRADVYALGVLLYELLAGSTPIDRKRLNQAALGEVLRIIRDQQPPRPSARISESNEALTRLAARRRMEPVELLKSVRGDLDLIVMKALEKDRTRRYDTADGLARDIERHLADEPVEACPPSVAYHVRKFAKRKRRLALAATAVFLALVAGLVGTTWGMLRAKRATQAESEQRRQAQKNEKIAHKAVDEARQADQREADQQAEVARTRAALTADSLVVAKADVVPYVLEGLHVIGRDALPPLWERFNEPLAPPAERLHAAYGLAELGEAPRGFLVDSVTAAPNSECSNLVAALTSVKGDVLPELHARINSAVDSSQKSRSIIVALHLGDIEPALEGLANRNDPIERTTFIQTYADWHANLEGVARLLSETNEPAFRSGLSAAIGRIAVEMVGPGERRALTRALAELFTNASDGGTHSAAGWALRRWKHPLPQIEPGSRPPEGRRWFVNGEGLTMLEIPAGRYTTGLGGELGQHPREIAMPSAFFISDREITIDEFERSANDEERPEPSRPKVMHRKEWTQFSPSPECAAGWVSWFDAVLYCNWLSAREGRRACYQLTGMETRSGSEFDPYQYRLEEGRCDLTADGYRLPTPEEWEYAARAGSHAKYCFGNNVELVPQYAWCGEISKSRIWPGGLKLPNAWGLFDMHGNVTEWCQLHPKGYLGSLRGGNFIYPADLCRFSYLLDQMSPYAYGFRVVCGK